MQQIENSFEAFSVTSENLHIRPLQQADFIPLARLYKYYTNHTVYTYYKGHVTPQYMQELLLAKGHLSAAATINDKAVGYVHITPSRLTLAKKGDIAIYVAPEQTNKGIGKRLLCYGEIMARNYGMQELRASVCTENIASLRLFDGSAYRRTYRKTNAAYKMGRNLHTQYFKKSLETTYTP